MEPTPEQKRAALESLNSCLSMDGDDGAGYLWDMMEGEFLATLRACLTDTEETPEERAAWIKDMVANK